MAHLNRVDGVIGSDLLDRLAATDRLHGDSGLELGTMGAALTHRWEPFQGRYPASEVNDGDCPKASPPQGKPLLCDDGRPMTTTEFLDQMRVHPVYGFLFQQRGLAGMQAAGGLTVSGIGSNGEPINPQALSASELYRASFAVN